MKFRIINIFRRHSKIEDGNDLIVRDHVTVIVEARQL